MQTSSHLDVSDNIATISGAAYVDEENVEGRGPVRVLQNGLSSGVAGRAEGPSEP